MIFKSRLCHICCNVYPFMPIIEYSKSILYSTFLCKLVYKSCIYNIYHCPLGEVPIYLLFTIREENNYSLLGKYMGYSQCACKSCKRKYRVINFLAKMRFSRVKISVKITCIFYISVQIHGKK